MICVLLVYCYDYYLTVILLFFRPFLWGEVAASRYSVRQGQGHPLTLVTQAGVDSVLECIDKDKLHESAYKLPLQRALQPNYTLEVGGVSAIQGAEGDNPH